VHARLRDLRQALAESRDPSSPSRGRYARVHALDGLLELAGDRALSRACVRVALEHLDAMGIDATEIEIDRVRTLRDSAAPTLLLGPPIDAMTAPTEMDKRAAAALEGLVRGPIPPPSDADHAEALALTTLAHLVGRRQDVALPLLAQLSALHPLPRPSWAVLIEACRAPRTRRAAHALATRLASEQPHDAPRPLIALAEHVDPRAAIPFLLAAFEAGHEGAAHALQRALEARALGQRDAGDRAGAIALLEAFEAAVTMGSAATLRRCLDVT
jgi:hypothetical protein